MKRCKIVSHIQNYCAKLKNRDDQNGGGKAGICHEIENESPGFL